MPFTAALIKEEALKIAGPGGSKAERLARGLSLIDLSFFSDDPLEQFKGETSFQELVLNLEDSSVNIFELLLTFAGSEISEDVFRNYPGLERLIKSKKLDEEHKVLFLKLTLEKADDRFRGNILPNLVVAAISHLEENIAIVLVDFFRSSHHSVVSGMKELDRYESSLRKDRALLNLLVSRERWLADEGHDRIGLGEPGLTNEIIRQSQLQLIERIRNMLREMIYVHPWSRSS